MKNLINTKSTPDIKPDNSGEINQEATVLKKKKKDRKEHEIYSIIYLYNSQEASSQWTLHSKLFLYNWNVSDIYIQLAQLNFYWHSWKSNYC